MQNPFRYFNNSPEVTRSAVMLYVRYPLSLRQVEDLLFEHGIDIGIVKLTDCRLFSAFLHEAKPLKLRRAAIENLPRFWSESG